MREEPWRPQATAAAEAVRDGGLPAPAPPLDVDLVRSLRPSNGWGALYLLLAAALTSAAIGLSLRAEFWWWLTGQVLLSAALLQWFALLHEAGHKTLFASPLANRLAGRLAGWFALIPYTAWTMIHARHHHWTGWQDLDVTTAALTPRTLQWWEKWSVNFCWFTGAPLFSTIYRLGNYWDIIRLWRLYPRPELRLRLALSLAGTLLAYGAAIWWFGPLAFLRVAGLAVFLTLMWQDPLILSQHTHIPMRLSGGREVAPIPPRQQQYFTRSLVFPAWFAQWILINLDAHELHHMYAQVPGYHLQRLSAATPNAMPWWLWLWRAKQIPGEVLLFHHRDETGFLI